MASLPRVIHPLYGWGTVVVVLDGGRMCVVRFDDRRTRVLPTRGLMAEPEKKKKKRPARPVAEKKAPPEGVDRQALEALRLGVVPVRGVHAITVGRHEELARIEEVLDRRSGMIAISGAYGAGKTHLVELAEAEALRRGMLVARATFDPDEVPPSHPLRLYGALTRQFVYPTGPGQGLRPLLEAVGDSARHIGGDRWHRWLSPALFALHHAPPDLADDVLDFVEGHGRDDHVELHTRLARHGYCGRPMYGLPDYRTFGQIMAHLLGGIATWAGDVGLKGLVLLLDEAEYLDRLGCVSRDMAENVLKYLAIAALPRKALGFSPDSVYRGGHAAHRGVSARFHSEQPLSAICAFTPNPAVDRIVRRMFASDENLLDLEPVRKAQLAVLAEKVFGLVQQVHPEVDPEPHYRQAVTKRLAWAFQNGEVETTRQAARMVVEYWDLYRVEPARAVAALNAP